MKSTYQYVLNNPTLASAFRYIVLNNTSNNAPYHHFHHMMTVTKYCMENLHHEGRSCEIKFESTEWYELLLAGMFHDMNHSQGQLEDFENVNMAITQFKDWRHHWCSDPNIDKYEVEEIIRATQYPYIIESEYLSQRQKIIRDADLMNCLEDDWFANIILGLGAEMKVYDINKMIDGQIGFHKTIKMETEFGKKMYNEKWEEHVFRPLNQLKEVFYDGKRI